MAINNRRSLDEEIILAKKKLMTLRNRDFERMSETMLKDKHIGGIEPNTDFLYGFERTFVDVYYANEITRKLYESKRNVISNHSGDFFIHYKKFKETDFYKSDDSIVFSDKNRLYIYSLRKDLPFMIVGEYKEMSNYDDIYIIEKFMCLMEDTNTIIKDCGLEEGDKLYGNPYIKWCTGIQSGRINSSAVKLEVNHEIKDSFYPAITKRFDCSVFDFIEKFKQSEESVLILTGKKGSGKTELIRHICASLDTDVTLTFNKELMQEDLFYNEFFSDNETNLLVIEDADTILTKRANGNPIMDLFLNLSDGLITSPKKKFIFTSNLPNSSSIDEALLRKGRCFAIIDFESLSEDEVDNILDDLDMSRESKKMLPKFPTLSDIFAVKNGALLNITEDNNTVEENSGSGFGFI